MSYGWDSNNDELRNQSRVMRDQQNQEFENGMGDDGFFKNPASGGFGSPMNGSQMGGSPMGGGSPFGGSPFGDCPSGGYEDGFGHSVGGSVGYQQPMQFQNAHKKEWTEVVWDGVKATLLKVNGFAGPVFFQIDDVWKSPVRFYKFTRSMLWFYLVCSSVGILGGVLNGFRSLPMVSMSLIGLVCAGVCELVGRHRFSHWESLKDQEITSIHQDQEGYEQKEVSSQVNQAVSELEYQNFGANTGWSDGVSEGVSDFQQGFGNTQVSPTMQGMVAPSSMGAFGVVDRGQSVGSSFGAVGQETGSTSVDDLWGEYAEEDEGYESEGEEASNTSVSDITRPTITQTNDSAFSGDVAGSELGADLVTRRALFDKFLSVLDGTDLKANWERKVEKGSREFEEIEDFLRDAQLGIKRVDESEWINVESITERLTIIEVVTNRPEMLKGESKANAFAQGLTALLQHSMGDTFSPNIYARVKGVGSRLYIDIFKQQNITMMLRDLLESERAFFENTDNELPVIFGFDERGRAIKQDLAKEVSTAIAGGAGSGKSVLASSIVTQMIALNPPTKVQFVAGDMKKLDSDWYDFTSPHFKYFGSGAEETMNMYRWVVNVESERRRELIGDAGVKKIQSYNAVRGDNPEMPYLFVIQDEIITFAKHVTKEEQTEWRGYLQEIITNYRNLGIFLLFIPHQFNNEFLPKTVSRLLNNKFVVRGSLETQSTVWDNAEREIKFPTTSPGDFAFTLSNDVKPAFGHAPLVMVSAKESGNRLLKLYEQQRKMWTKLCPDEVANSAYFKREQDKGALELMGSLGLSASQKDFQAEDSKNARYIDGI